MDLDRLAREDALLKLAQSTKGADVGAVETLLILTGSAEAVNAGLERFLAGYGLSLGRFYLLLQLIDTEEGLKPSDLAEGAGVRRATVSGLLEGLERDGLVHRSPDPEDRRAVRVFPTRIARGLMDGVLKEFYTLIAIWFGGVSGGGRRTIEGVLDSIVEKIPLSERNLNPDNEI